VLSLLLYPPTEAGVWLDPVPAVAARPFDVTGEAQAPEGVLRVDLYLSGRAVASYVPTVPAVGTVTFALRFDPALGTGTLRVVATTLVRGLDAEAPAPARPAAPAAPAAHRARAASGAARPAAPARPAAAARPAAPAAVAGDDSGAAFGAVAPVLPYSARPATPVPPPAATPPGPRSADPLPAPRSGPASLAAGLALLLASAHLHRALRPKDR
jgi:hypothetical protein